ncbi:CIA30 family protein [Ascidiaceihabitans sp.]|nr:CIA30 family protein [Ascidiaceihabitans sp.]
MKTITASLFALLLALINGGAMADNIIKTGQWSYFADTVMGGVSEGAAKFEDQGLDQVIRLIGEVSTANNGGFIQVRSPVLWEAAKGKTGIKLTIKGNGDQYYLHIRTANTRLPWHYYQLSFQTNGSWREVRLPFDAFVKSSSLMKTKLNQSKIKTIGIVAYGKDYSADVSVQGLEFY